MSNGTPFFTIVIPAYNRKALLPRALSSVLAQTYVDFECVVVDDCSYDGTGEVMAEANFRDDRLRLVKHDENEGLNQARRTGIDHARGHWVVFLDSDDELLPHALDHMQKSIVADQNNAQLFGFSYAFEGKPAQAAGCSHVLKDCDDFFRWTAERSRPPDILCCLNRRSLAAVHYPTWHKAEFFFFIEFSNKFVMVFIHSEPLAIVHYDAPNSLSRAVKSRWCANSRERASIQRVCQGLNASAESLARFAPGEYRGWLRYILRVGLTSGRIRLAVIAALQLVLLPIKGRHYAKRENTWD